MFSPSDTGMKAMCIAELVADLWQQLHQKKKKKRGAITAPATPILCAQDFTHTIARRLMICKNALERVWPAKYVTLCNIDQTLLHSQIP